MTNYKQAPNNRQRGGNIKDGHHPGRRPKSQSALYESLGFVMVDWNAYTYQWAGERYPKFTIRPGAAQGKHGIVARHQQTEIVFDYGTAPHVIKAMLDDVSAHIMEYDANLADAGMEWLPQPWIDIDAFMAAP